MKVQPACCAAVAISVAGKALHLAGELEAESVAGRDHAANLARRSPAARPTNRPSCDRVRSKNGREELPIQAVGTPGTHPHPPVSSRRGGRVGVEPSAAPFADESRIGRGVVRPSTRSTSSCRSPDPVVVLISDARSWSGVAGFGCDVDGDALQAAG